MAQVMYNVAKTRVASGSLALDTGDLQALIITGSKTGADDPDLGSLADIDALTGVGFHTERVTLTGLSVSQDNVNDRAVASAASFSFSPAAGVVGLALLIFDNAGAGSDGFRFPVCFYDTGFGTGLPMDSGLDVTINGDYLELT